jgi:hypothetical protein
MSKCVFAIAIEFALLLLDSDAHFVPEEETQDKASVHRRAAAPVPSGFLGEFSKELWRLR